MSKSLTNTKQRLLAVLAAALLALAAFACTGCGPNDEEQVREVLDAQLSALSNPSDETIKDALGTDLAEDATFQKLGIDSTELVTSWLNGYSYEIGDISVDGDNATAKATITSKQLYTIMTSWKTSFSEDVMNQGFTSEDEVYAYAGQTFSDAVNNAEASTTEVTFALQKDNGEWKYSESDATNQQALADALFGGGVTGDEVFG